MHTELIFLPKQNSHDIVKSAFIRSSTAPKVCVLSTPFISEQTILRAVEPLYLRVFICWSKPEVSVDCYIQEHRAS